MAIGASEMGSAIGGFFGEDKVKPQYYNKALAQLYNNDYVTALKNLGTTGTSALADYNAAFQAATPTARALNAQDIASLGSLIRGGVNYDPLASYERIRSGNIDALTKQFGALENYGSASDKLNLAARGYGGRGDSGYERILRADRISGNVAPVLNTIYGNLGSDMSRADAARSGNLASTLGLMSARSALPDALAARSMMPYTAASNVLGTQLGNAGTLGTISRENTAGFKTEKNPWKNFFEQSGAGVDELANTGTQVFGKVLDTFGNIFSLGMGGGGGGPVGTGQLNTQYPQYPYGYGSSGFGSLYGMQQQYPAATYSPYGYGMGGFGGVGGLR